MHIKKPIYSVFKDMLLWAVNFVANSAANRNTGVAFSWQQYFSEQAFYSR